MLDLSLLRLFMQLQSGFYPVLDEPCLSLRLDLLHSLHGFDRLLPQFSAVFDRHVAMLLKLEGSVHCQFFAVSLPERLRPSHFAWVTLSLESFVALRPTKSEQLAVVSDKHNSMAGINVGRTKVTFFNPHFRSFTFN